MKVQKSDITLIGFAAFENSSGCLTIIAETRGSDYILLREILKIFGDYRILHSRDLLRPDGTCDWEMETNLPYKIYASIKPEDF